MVKFLSGGPRKETESPFSGNRELWFDIEYQGQKQTWTISQVSLLAELKRMAPLTDRNLHIQLVPVDDEFRKKWPKFKGKDRYAVKPAVRKATPTVEEKVIDNLPMTKARNQ